MFGKKITDAEIARIVESFFQRKVGYNDDEDRFRAAGKRATPFLVKALSDTKRVTARFADIDDFAQVKSPLDRIQNLISRDHLPEVVDPLVALLGHDDVAVREHAALALGVLAADKCAAPILQALSDREKGVVEYAIIGIRRAVKRKEFDVAFVTKIFPALHDLIRKQDAERGNKVAQLMLEIDRKRAIASLAAADVLTVDNRRADEVLRALNDASITIGHDLLLPLLRDVKQRAAERPYDRVYAEALKAYGRNPDDKAEVLLRAEIENANEEVQAGAAEALAALKGVHDALRYVFAKQTEAAGDFDGLSVPQQHYMAVYLCNAEVNNGGFSVYFVNSSAESWPEALAGYRAIGAVERERLLRKAVELFGPQGPALDKGQRDEQRATWPPEHRQKLDALDTEYYKCKENVKALLARYAAAHHSHFHD
jgi:HEAT repeat protein